jgi:predicted Zn-dependent peptidase
MKLRILYTLLIGFITLTATAQIDRSKAPKAQPNPEIKIQKPDVFKLDNGLTVIVVENHKLPKVSFQLYVDHDPIKENDKAGLSDMFGEMLGTGTKNLTKDDLDQQIDFMGADFMPSSRGFFATSLSKHTDKLLTILSDVVLNPVFPETEFERIKTQTLSALASSSTDPNAMSSNISNVVNFGKNHPYGEVVTEETVNNVKIDDIKNHYNTYFKPNISYLVVVGDVTPQQAKDYAQTYFNKWSTSEVPAETYEVAPRPEANQVYFAEKPGAVQSVINITQTIDLKPGNDDVIKLRVYNSILGGGSFSARLMSNLREDKAYTYGCYSRITPDELKGEFNAGGSFRNEVTDSAIVQILYEINKIYNEPVTDAELDLVKKSMTGAFARSLENPQTIARFALNTIRYNLPADYYATYLKKLEAVTVEELLEVGKKYLNPNQLNIVVVGNTNIADKLIQFDGDGKITYKDAYGNDKANLKPVPDGVTAKSIINQFILKSFNVENDSELAKKQKSIGFVQTTSKARFEQMGADFIMTTYKTKPNKSAVVIKVVQGDGPGQIMQKEWFNGEKGKTFVMMQGSKDMDTDEVKKRQSKTFPFEQMSYFTDENLDIELLGIEEVGGTNYYKFKIQRKGSEDFSFEYYNIESGLLEIEETFSKDEEGNPHTAKVYTPEYKVYGKGKYTLLLPAKTIIETEGPKLEFETNSVIIKKKSKSKVFDGYFD